MLPPDILHQHPLPQVYHKEMLDPEGFFVPIATTLVNLAFHQQMLGTEHLALQLKKHFKNYEYICLVEEKTFMGQAD